ncbi:hypothetical protein GCM10007907_27990 [Chitinimonas prasina]|uniref:Uncharacterized protein n=1 Tax=Chitinimonas prasina TaxID=1434937 RepID=A0ABQ5YM77_9NEIS|nr:hypothetical protein [Chitinimonas prasina]GLR14009.1 hypothetical protein GCM10007907_27990 [Chitinimonas prasina]
MTQSVDRKARARTLLDEVFSPTSPPAGGDYHGGDPWAYVFGSASDSVAAESRDGPNWQALRSALRAMPMPGAAGIADLLDTDVGRDTAIALTQGAIQLPEAGVGLGDLMTTPQRLMQNKLLEAAGSDVRVRSTTDYLDSAGVSFADARKDLDQHKSGNLREGMRLVSEADGFWSTIKAAASNPLTIYDTVLQSAPSLLVPIGVGGKAAQEVAIVAGRSAFARALSQGATEEAAAAIARKAGQEAVKAASGRLTTQGSAMEGVQTAGATAAEFEAEGDLDARKALASVGAGLTTAALGKLVSEIPGFGDMESSLAASAVSSSVNRPTGSFPARLIKSAVQEGVVEEGSQSATEKMWQNFGDGKAIMDGVGNALATGMLAGMAMGGGMETVNTLRGLAPAAPEAPTATAVDTSQLPHDVAVATVAAAPIAPVVELQELPDRPVRGLVEAAMARRVTAETAAVLGSTPAEEGTEREHTTGQQAAKYKAEEELDARTAVASVGAGPTTNVFGKIGARFPRMGDMESSLAASAFSSKVNRAAAALPTGLAKGAVQEGVLEEMPQSATERMWENFGERSAMLEGVDKAAALGIVTGAALGAGVQLRPPPTVAGEGEELPSDSGGEASPAVEPAQPLRSPVTQPAGVGHIHDDRQTQAGGHSSATLRMPTLAESSPLAAEDRVPDHLSADVLPIDIAHASVEAGIVQAPRAPPQNAMRPDGTLQIIGHPAQLRAYLSDIGMGSVPAVPFAGGVIIGASVAPQVYAALKQEESSSHSASLMESDKGTASPQAPLDAEQVRVTLGRRLSRMGDVAEVVQSLDDLPAELRSLIKGVTGIEGIFFRDKIWLIADGLASLPRAQQVLEHEVVGHFAMEKLAAQDEYQQAIRSVAAMEKSSNALIQELATFIDSAQPGLPPVRRIQEIMARAVETGVYRQSPRLHRITADVTRQVKAILRRMGFEPKWTNELTIEEVFSLLREGDRRVDAGLKAYSGRLAKLASAAELEHSLRRPVDRMVSANQMLEQIRNASDVAAAELDGDPEAERQESAKLGPFSGYLIYGEVVGGSDPNLEELLYVRVYGDEQLKQGLLNEAALTFFVSPAGELAMNGPSPTQDTFASFKQLGWVDHAFDAAGVIQDGWSSLADPLNPGAPLPLSQLLPLLADVHARLRTWRREDAVELFWSGGTGTTDSFDGANELLGNGASLSFSKAGPQSAYHEIQADTVAVPATLALPDAIVAHDLKALQGEDYLAATRGDVGLAMKVARRLLTPEVMKALRERVPEQAIVLGVNSMEEAGGNAIPQTVAALLALRMGLEVDGRIVRSSISKRPAMDGLSRILNRPRFAGPVQTGGQYLLIDDALPQGDKLAALARHILQGGGHVAAIVALTDKPFSAPLAPAPSLLRQVREKYGDVEDAFRQATGYDYQSLTASEARYLTNYKSVDVVRDRILAEARQRAKPTDKRSVNEPRKTPPQGGVAVSTDSILPSKGARYSAEGGNGLAQKTGPHRETQHSQQKSATARTESPPSAASSPEHYSLSQAASPIASADGHAKNALATYWIDRREARILRNVNRAAYPNRQVPRSVMIDLAGLSSAHPNARYAAMKSLVDNMQRAAAWGGYSSGTSTEPWDGNVSITPISAAEQQQIDMVAESFMVAAELTNASMTQDGFAVRDNALKDLRKQMCSLSQNQQAQLVAQLTDQIAATKEMRGWYGNIGWKADQAKFKDAVQATGWGETLNLATGPGVLVGGSTTKDMASLPKVATAGVAPAFGNSLSMLRRQVATGFLRLGWYKVPSKGVPINGATRTTPLGFNQEPQFLNAAQELQDALKASGINDATIGVRGSSVTGYSLTKGTKFSPQSDIDFFVESGQLTEAYKTSKNIPGFVHPNKILPDYPLLQDWAAKWTNTLGRDVTPGAFVPGTLPGQPSILVK